MPKGPWKRSISPWQQWQEAAQIDMKEIGEPLMARDRGRGKARLQGDMQETAGALQARQWRGDPKRCGGEQWTSDGKWTREKTRRRGDDRWTTDGRRAKERPKEACRRQLEHFRRDSEGETQRDVEGINDLLTARERGKTQRGVEIIGGLLTVGERRKDLRRHGRGLWTPEHK